MEKRSIRILLQQIQDPDPLISAVIEELKDDEKRSNKVVLYSIICLVGLTIGYILGIYN